MGNCTDVLVVIGTRPEAIKMAPVVCELRRRTSTFKLVVCLTAQHRQMLDQAISLFGIPIHFDFNLMQHDQTIVDVTCKVVQRISGILDETDPDVVLVQGDTTTAFAAALASFYKHIPVGHIEAGLRTYRKYQPFPEEMNRRLVDTLCDYHYAPTPGARDNLLKENIPGDHIVVTGNTVIDAMLDVAERQYTFKDPLLEDAGRHHRLLLVTAHRRESFGEPLIRICEATRDLAKNNHDLDVIYLVHPNPHVRVTVNEVLVGQERVHLIEPLEYLPFVHLLKKSSIVLTDSGGIQEEAPSLGKPVLVMREVTERPEGIMAGTAQLVGTTYRGIITAVQHLLDNREAYNAMAKAVNPYGDGLASKRIADHLEKIIKTNPH